MMQPEPFETFACDPYYEGRKAYMTLAQKLALTFSPENALEIGPGPSGLPILRGSDTMDLRGDPTYRHDAGLVPWPVADKSYDVVIALQVWEHLCGKQRAAFSEVKRVACRGAVLSFPYMWGAGSDIHREIGFRQIVEWTEQSPACLVGPSLQRLRAVCYYEL